MSRYIDADAFDDTVQRLNEQGWHITRIDYKRMDRVLFEMPTADVVEVVRCKDCKHYKIDHPRANGYHCCYRMHSIFPMKPDDFCSYAERREDDKE